MEKFWRLSIFIACAVSGLFALLFFVHYLSRSYEQLGEIWFVALVICAYSSIVAVLAGMREASLDDEG